MCVSLYIHILYSSLVRLIILLILYFCIVIIIWSLFCYFVYSNSSKLKLSMFRSGPSENKLTSLLGTTVDKIYNKFGLQCQTPLSLLSLGNSPNPSSLIPYPISLYPLSLMPYPYSYPLSLIH